MKKYILLTALYCIIYFSIISCESGGRQGAVSWVKDNDTLELVFDNFEEGSGFEVVSRNHKRYVRLDDRTTEGSLEEYLFDKSARYDITLFFVDEPTGSSKIDLFINERFAGSFPFDLFFPEKSRSKEVTISDVNIRKWSRITLRFKGDDEEKCLVEKLVLTPKGKFEGKYERLKKPFSPEVFVKAEDRIKARQLYADFVNYRADSVRNKRVTDLGILKSPLEWKIRQQQARLYLPEFIGEFPEKTPLNPRIVGTIDREQYKIEKIIFESQPDYYVTANFYVPKNRSLPAPGVLFTCGHSAEAKAALLYHEACLGLVLKGYTVLAFDPMGQGERSEYIDPETRENRVGFNVPQHHYIGKPSLLVDWSLAGLRIWDGIRALDYLVSRPEVDRSKIAAVGNSGGGEMAMLITAVDERIRVCAAAHPGGSMEETYLGGGQIINREIFSLIPPRPCRVIVGSESGEEARHRKKIEDMQLFYEGLGFSKDLGELVLVDGVHDMKLPKREATYEWLNKWLGREDEGKDEPALSPENVENLRCTKEGSVLLALGGETAQTLNSKRADKIYRKEFDPDILIESIAERIGLKIPVNLKVPEVNRIEKMKIEGIRIEKFAYESEEGMIIPALLMIPNEAEEDASVYICVAEKGKPRSFSSSSVPFSLVKKGFIVLAIDVRGTGETSPAPVVKPDIYTGYDVLQWKNDVPAMESSSFGKTTLAMRAHDIISGINYIKSRKDLKKRRIIVSGEGLGGLWAMVAAIYDIRVNGVMTTGTLTSYLELVKNQYYNLQNYFWVPGALRDFDIPDLARLVSPKPQVWIHPVNGLNEEVGFIEAATKLGNLENLEIITPEKSEDDVTRLMATIR